MKTNYHKIKTLKGHNAFKKAFNDGKVFSSRAMLLTVVLPKELDSEKQDCNEIELGVTISKRSAKKAIIRNRVKRLLREAFRQLIKEKYLSVQLPFNKIVIAWKIAPKHHKLIRLDDVKSELDYIFSKAIKYYKVKI